MLFLELLFWIDSKKLLARSDLNSYVSFWMWRLNATQLSEECLNYYVLNNFIQITQILSANLNIF